jgi:hypothetical protein
LADEYEIRRFALLYFGRKFHKIMRSTIVEFYLRRKHETQKSYPCNKSHCEGYLFRLDLGCAGDYHRSFLCGAVHALGIICHPEKNINDPGDNLFS